MTPHSRASCGPTSAAAFVNGHDVTGGITTALGGVWDTTGDGLTNTVTPGSDYDYAAGVITDYDVSQAAINHMVRLAISADALKSPGADWMHNIPWPNNHEDYSGRRTTPAASWPVRRSAFR